MKYGKQLWILGLFMLLLVGCLGGRVDLGGYEVSGQVTNDQGMGVAGVTVVITGETAQTVETDSTGRWSAMVQGSVRVRPMLGESIFAPQERILTQSKGDVHFALQTKIIPEGNPSIALTVQTLQMDRMQVQAIGVREITGISGASAFAIVSEEGTEVVVKGLSGLGYGFSLHHEAVLVVLDGANKVLAETTLPHGNYRSVLPLVSTTRIVEEVEKEVVPQTGGGFLASGYVENREYVEERIPLHLVDGGAIGDFPSGFIVINDIAVELDYAFAEEVHFNVLLDGKFAEVGYSYDDLHLYIKLPGLPDLIDAKTGLAVSEEEKDRVLAEVRLLYDAQYPEGSPMVHAWATVSVRVLAVGPSTIFRVWVYSVEGVDGAEGFTILDPENPATAFGYEMARTTLEDTMPVYILGTGGSVLYTLTMEKTGDGSVTPAEGQHAFREGETVPLQAVPGQGYDFLHWLITAGSLDDPNNPHTTFTMPGEDVRVTAVFLDSEHRDQDWDAGCSNWTAETNGGGVGITEDRWDFSVVRSGAVIDFRFNAFRIPDRFWIYYNGDLVLETGWRGNASYDGNPLYPGGIAGPGQGEVLAAFTKVEGVDYFTVRVEGAESNTEWNYQLRCRLEGVEYTLTMEKTGQGTITPVEGDHIYAEGTVVNVSAQPASGWEFVRWEGDVTEPNSSQVIMDGNKTVRAVFEETNPNPGVVLYGNFGLTVEVFADQSDWDQIVLDLFGPDYRVADWNDLKGFYANGGDLLALYDGLGLTEHGNSAYVTRNGNRIHSGGRYYFASRHEHNRPPHYAAHDHINNYQISLGSWWGSNYIMAIRRSETSTPGEQTSHTAGGVGFNMRLAPAATFPTGIEGIPDDERDERWEPLPGTDTVEVPFWIAETQVTYELWYTVRQWGLNNGYTFQNAGREGSHGSDGQAPTSKRNEPVTRVSWKDGIVWANALSEMLGYNPVYTYQGNVIRDSRKEPACDKAVQKNTNGFRLPTSFEWELAARYKGNDRSHRAISRGGLWWTRGNYASGATADYNNASATQEVAWYSANSGSTTKDVGLKRANGLGVYDMSGNVWEWCFTEDGCCRVVRGGSWDGTASGLRVGNVNSINPDFVDVSLGLRLARTHF